MEEHRNIMSQILNLVKEVCTQCEHSTDNDYTDSSEDIRTLLKMKQAETMNSQRINQKITDLQIQWDDLSKQNLQLNEMLQLEENNYKRAQEIKNLYEKECKSLEKEKKSLMDTHLSHEESKKLAKSKAQVQCCKVLTSTNFDYNCSNVRGYMQNNSTMEKKAFVLKSHETPTKKMEYLWKTLEKMFSYE